MAPLTAWANFYDIVGSSAGALTGLTFVVISLAAQTRRQRDTEQGVAAFTTPTVVHFGSVLLATAILSAPWTALYPPAILFGLLGLAGIFYSAIIVRRQRRLQGYKPVLEDWAWYVVSPLVAYSGLLAAAIRLPGSPGPALFVVGGVMILLLFTGIRNAWDIVIFLVVARMARDSDKSEG